jgi:hypothetical protein
LVKQKDLAMGAYEELLANPSKITHPDAYGRIAFGAARAIGYQEALAAFRTFMTIGLELFQLIPLSQAGRM